MKKQSLVRKLEAYENIKNYWLVTFNEVCLNEKMNVVILILAAIAFHL